MLDNIKLHTHKEFTELKADRDALVTKLQESETAVSNLQAMSVTMTEKQAAHDTVLADLNKKHEEAVATLKADYEKQISDLTNKLQAESVSSEAKAIKTLAQIGVPAETLPVVTNNIEDEAKLKGYRIISHLPKKE